MNVFSDLRSLTPQQIWTGVVARALHTDRVTVSIVELDANTVIPEHSHENEQVGVLLSGSLTFRVAGETRELALGAAWSIPANAPHDIATGPDGAVVIEVFAPPRVDWARLERLPPSPPRWPV